MVNTELVRTTNPEEALKEINKIPLFEFCGALIPANWITGFNFSLKSKSVTIELLNKGKLKNYYKDGDEARKEYSIAIKQYEDICEKAREQVGN